jgi:hypothetical protein
MAIRYFCDCCGREVKSEKDFEVLEYNLASHHDYNEVSLTKQSKSLCFKCYLLAVNKMVEFLNERKESLKPTE